MMYAKQEMQIMKDAHNEIVINSTSFGADLNRVRVVLLPEPEMKQMPHIENRIVESILTLRCAPASLPETP